LGRFLDEAAVKLARLNGDPVLAAKFAGMPIMLLVAAIPPRSIELEHILAERNIVWHHAEAAGLA
jgi:hypothetical protein